MRLKNKVAIVTGSGQGIGRAEALLFAKEGASVIVNDIGHTPDGASTADLVAAEIRDTGGQAISTTDSVSTMEGARRIVAAAIDAYGRLDILVNNAGGRGANTISRMTEAQWDTVLDSHLKGSFAMIKFASEHFKRQHAGAIVNTGSYSGLGHPFNSGYAAAKEGLAGLTRTVARELGRFGVRCNLLRPMAVGTRDAWYREFWPKTHPLREALGRYWVGDRWSEERSDYSSPGVHDAQSNRVPEMTPSQVAPMTVWLCTDAAAHVNGRCFGVRGERIELFSEPEVIRTVTRTKGWDLDSIDSEASRILTSDMVDNFAVDVSLPELD